MRNLLLIAFCLAAFCSAGADEEERPGKLLIVPSPQVFNELETTTAPNESLEKRRILKEKLTELRSLQSEIIQLGGEISPPVQRIRVSLRAVELNCSKLKTLGLSHPLPADDPDPHDKRTVQQAHHVAAPFANEEELLQVFEPLIVKGWPKFLANPTVIASVGQSTIVSCFRDVPHNRVMDVPGDHENPQQVRSVSPGFEIETLPRLLSDGRIHLDLCASIIQEDLANAITFNGNVIPGMTRRRVQMQIKLKPGEPTLAGSGRITSHEASEKNRGIRNVVASTFMKPKPAAPKEHEMEFHWFVIAEVVPSGDRGATSK